MIFSCEWCVLSQKIYNPTIDSTSDRSTVAASLKRDLAAISSWAGTWLVTFNLDNSDLLTLSRKEDCSAFRKGTPILLDTYSAGYMRSSSSSSSTSSSSNNDDEVYCLDSKKNTSKGSPSGSSSQGAGDAAANVP